MPLVNQCKIMIVFPRNIQVTKTYIYYFFIYNFVLLRNNVSAIANWRQTKGEEKESLARFICISLPHMLSLNVQIAPEHLKRTTIFFFCPLACKIAFANIQCTNMKLLKQKSHKTSIKSRAVSIDKQSCLKSDLRFGGQCHNRRLVTFEIMQSVFL